MIKTMSSKLHDYCNNLSGVKQKHYKKLIIECAIMHGQPTVQLRSNDISTKSEPSCYVLKLEDRHGCQITPQEVQFKSSCPASE